MADINTKDKYKSVRTLDKAKAWTERIKDPIVYTNKKINDINNNEKGINEYSEDKIKYTANRLKDETIYANKKIIKKTSNEIKKHRLSKKVNKESPNIENKISDIPSKETKVVNSVKNKVNTSNEKSKVSKRILEQGKKIAINGSKKISEGSKKVGQKSVSMIKGIMKSIKSLIAMLGTGGIFIVLIVLIFAIAGAIVSSVFGIFLSSENVENSIKMSDCIKELSNEMDNKINLLKRDSIYDEYIIDSNMASWKDILSIYAVRVAKGDNATDVIIMDKDKKEILREVYWDMNNITHNVQIEEYQSDAIGTLEDIDLTDIRHHTLPTYETQNTNKKYILHINIRSKNINEMKEKYNFNEEQLKQYEELTSEEYDSLWYAVIYGNYKDNGEIDDWKQAGREWSNIKIGTTNKTIGGIGCLTTSIAILIKKSNVQTPNIYPFNPGTFVIALNNKYGFDAHGNLLYGAINKAVPNFKYAGTIELKGKSKNEKLYQIKKYSDSGYFLAIEVKGATKNSQHWVALDRVDDNRVLMHDPSSGNEKDMWNKYDWNKTSQFIYFKTIN